MKDINKKQSIIILVGLVLFLLVIDSQCWNKNEACLPDMGYIISAPNVISDQDLLLKGLANGTINSEWKEKIGEVYGLIASEKITGNYHSFSIISSVLLLLVTYQLMYKITQNRISSIIPVIIIDFSRTFLWYNDSIPYPGFWCVLFFLSLYPFKNKLIRPIAYLTSFIMKAQSLAFLPITVLREKDNRIRVFYIGVGVLAAIVASLLKWTRIDGFNIGNLAPPYVVFEIILQDFWIIVLFFPVSALLFYLHKQKVEWAGTILIGMLWSLFFQYILALFTTYGAFSERMLPFVVFFAMGSGLIISKKDLLLNKIRHYHSSISSS